MSGRVTSLVLVSLIGGGFIAVTLAVSLSGHNLSRRRRVAKGLAGTLMMLGAISFFGTAFAAEGGLDRLGPSFAWPVGYSRDVVTMADGLHVVPLEPSGRIQIYDRDWRFLRGWRVDAGGGSSWVGADGPTRLIVTTARTKLRLTYSTGGTELARVPRPAGPYPTSSPGQLVWVATSWWKWPFVSPFYGWLCVAVGMLALIALDPRAHRRRRSRLRRPRPG